MRTHRTQQQWCRRENHDDSQHRATSYETGATDAHEQSLVVLAVAIQRRIEGSDRESEPGRLQERGVKTEARP